MIQKDNLVTIFCVAWILFDWTFSEKLFEANHTFTLWLQGSEKDINAFRFQIFKLITQLGYEPAIGSMILIGFMFFANKVQSLKVLIATLISSYILTILKLIYHEPRPYFVFQDLQGIGCDTEFGKPSGHAMVTLILYYLVFDSVLGRKFFTSSNSVQFIWRMKNKNIGTELPEIIVQETSQNDTRTNAPPINQSVNLDEFLESRWIFSAYCLMVFLIGLSRVVLGAHSFGQVVLGWAWGTLFVIAYRKFFENWLEDLLLTVGHQAWDQEEKFNKYLSVLIMVYAVGLIFATGLFYVVDSQVTPEQKQMYIENIHSKPYCLHVDPNSHKFLAKKCLSDSATLSLVVGILFASLISKGTYNPSKWNESYSLLPISKKIFRIVLLAVVAGIIAIPLHFLHFENIYVHYFLKATIQALGVGIGIIKVYPYVLFRLKLDIYGDFLKHNTDYSFFDISFQQDNQLSQNDD